MALKKKTVKILPQSSLSKLITMHRTRGVLCFQLPKFGSMSDVSKYSNWVASLPSSMGYEVFQLFGQMVIAGHTEYTGAIICITGKRSSHNFNDLMKKLNGSIVFFGAIHSYPGNDEFSLVTLDWEIDNSETGTGWLIDSEKLVISHPQHLIRIPPSYCLIGTASPRETFTRNQFLERFEKCSSSIDSKTGAVVLECTDD